MEVGMIEKLMFGRTGHLSTRLLFGAAAFGNVTQAEADQTMELLLETGINHIDTAASYGQAEERLGPWTAKYRDRFFLATKTGKRTYAEAKTEIHRSLELMHTDHLDALQLHAVIGDEEFETAMGPGGALEAAVEARSQGLVRFIGITSHSLHAPVIHRMALERFDFDSVLLPCNYMLMQNPQYKADFDILIAICQSKNVAVQMIKTAQRRPYAEGERSHATWYKPFETQPELDLATHWALARPDVFINTAGDIHILPMVLDAAKRFAGKPSDAQMDAMLLAQEAAPLWA
jgi:aryl-alcohol dehydrogenase-like predicted oxidoreductase